MLENMRGGLYKEPKYNQGLVSSCKSTFVSSDQEIMLWHHRLGHPSFPYLKNFFPLLFINKNPCFFEVCQLAKDSCATFPGQPNKSSKSFSMIHSDIWRLLE